MPTQLEIPLVMHETEIGNERLLLLADFLDTVPKERFNYSQWVGHDWAGAADLSCGTTACALGWATVIPEFRALGLSMFRYNTADAYGHVLLEVNGHRYINYEAAIALFDLTDIEAELLFSPHEENDFDPEYAGLTFSYEKTRLADAIGYCSNRASAKDVANLMRRFVQRRKIVGEPL